MDIKIAALVFEGKRIHKKFPLTHYLNKIIFLMVYKFYL